MFGYCLTQKSSIEGLTLKEQRVYVNLTKYSRFRKRKRKIKIVCLNCQKRDLYQMYDTFQG